MHWIITHKLILASFAAMTVANGFDARSSLNFSARPGYHEVNPILAHHGRYTATSAISEFALEGAAISIEIGHKRLHLADGVSDKRIAWGNLAAAGATGAVAWHNYAMVK